MGDGLVRVESAIRLELESVLEQVDCWVSIQYGWKQKGRVGVTYHLGALWGRWRERAVLRVC